VSDPSRILARGIAEWGLDEDQIVQLLDDCPNREKHAVLDADSYHCGGHGPRIQGHWAWTTHSQERCPGCDLDVIWIRRRIS
jgi:hypothetical protein